MLERSGSLPFVCLVIGVAVLRAMFARAQSQDEALKVSVSCETNAREVEITMTFQNSAAIDTSLYLGEIVANGKKYLANAVSAEVRDTHGATKVKYFDPSVPGIAGRLDPWVITLPEKSSFTFGRPLGHFWADGSPLSARQEPFEFRIRFDASAVPAEYAIPQFRAFVGELRSEWFNISGDWTAA